MTDARAAAPADLPTDGDEPAAPPSYPLLELSDGVPPVVESTHALRQVVAAFAAGTGPVAIDAERASGYRYGQRCYLVQLRREGSGTALIDPLGCPDLSSLDEALADAEWILHAANQDLPCLADLGLRPRALFDTEVAARLAGYERVGLATMVEVVLGRRLDKGNSSADWSQRPLSPALLRYAALDVEPLVELRDHLERELTEQGKIEWAREEFAAIATAPPAIPRVEPWRRTSGMHRIRQSRQLAGVRAMWELRDEIARKRDIAPGRILPDSAIVEAVLKAPTTPDALAEIAPFSGRSLRRQVDVWHAALARAATLPNDALPTTSGTSDGGPPPAHRWAERDPVAAGRLARTRAAIAAVAAEHSLPVENLLEPAVLRRLAWQPPPSVDADSVAEALAVHGARLWQVRLTAASLADALLEPPPAADSAASVADDCDDAADPESA
ncbi:MAG TPA: HRDC domain-containing protein [Mycobacteriales bacterium]|nr:HRDC domain-containing protein [Mycobacteriales bacterium]